MGQENSMPTDTRPQTVSGELTVPQLEAELVYVVEELRGLGVEFVKVYHWMGEEEVAVSALVQAFGVGFENCHYRTPQTRVRLGMSDFEIYTDGLPTEFEFCHHYELHVKSDDDLLLGRFRSRWQSLGYKVR